MPNQSSSPTKVNEGYSGISGSVPLVVTKNNQGVVDEINNGLVKNKKMVLKF